MSQETHVEEVVAEGLDEEDSWMNCTRQKILVAVSDGRFHEEHLIYRVHSPLREENPSSYEPTAISIGPYHWGKEHLLDMETHKRKYVHHLLSRNKNIRLEDLVKKMKEREEQVRGCYPGKITLRGNAFIEMMLLDGCFIVEFLLKIKHGHRNDDLFVGPHWRLVALWFRDLVLLENQLPFFLLQEIFKVMMPDETDPLALVKLSLKFLKGINQTQNPKEEVLPTAPESVHHLLHLWHMQLFPFPKQPQDSIPPAKQPHDSKIHKLMHLIRIPTKQLQDSNILKCNKLTPCFCMRNCCKGTIQKQENLAWLPGATQLEEAGVKFKPSNNNLLDIEFSKGEMMIPPFYVVDYTETQLRNLVAFEQCCQYPSSSMDYFSCYVTFLDFLINTSKDVEILHKKGILSHWLGEDEEVARLFNKLTKGIIINMSKSYLGDTIARINHYRSKKIHKWRASLARDYFYSPWAVLSFLGAIVALTLTAISAAYSIKSFNNDLHQPK